MDNQCLVRLSFFCLIKLNLIVLSCSFEFPTISKRVFDRVNLYQKLIKIFDMDRLIPVFCLNIDPPQIFSISLDYKRAKSQRV